MNPNRLPQLQRREFLRRASSLSLAGAAMPWALNLAAIGEAAAADSSGGYKALVCVFLMGGNDGHNTLVPVDSAGHANYLSRRAGLGTALAALQPSQLLSRLPGDPQLALAPQLLGLKPLFDQGRLGMLLNVGPLVQPTTRAQFLAKSVPLPPKLFSHNDQQSVWQSSQAEGSTRGWGGSMGDLFLSSNASSTFTCINASGNAVFLSGQQALQYQVSSNGAVAVQGLRNPLYGSSACSEMLRSLMTGAQSHWMAQELTRVSIRSIEAEQQLSAALAAAPAPSTAFNTGSALGRQMQIVARLIAARAQLGAQRQVFMVALGGFDNHDNLLESHPGLLEQLGGALQSFDAAMLELGVSEQVTTFTASDFGRTLTSNGNGSDHGWGSHHFVMGGAVRGGRFWGRMPDLSMDSADDVGQGRLLPSTSVDQLAATLARWMGVSDGELPLVVPNIGNFSQRDLGFFAA